MHYLFATLPCINNESSKRNDNFDLFFPLNFSLKIRFPFIRNVPEINWIFIHHFSDFTSLWKKEIFLIRNHSVINCITVYEAMYAFVCIAREKRIERMYVVVVATTRTLCFKYSLLLLCFCVTQCA